MDNDLLFLGMDIPVEVKKLLDREENETTKNMTEDEKLIYKLGIKNVMFLLECILEFPQASGDEDFVIHIQGLEIPTELDLQDIRKYIEE